MAATMLSAQTAAIAARADRLPPPRHDRFDHLRRVRRRRATEHGTATIVALIAEEMPLVVVAALGPNTARTKGKTFSR